MADSHRSVRSLKRHYISLAITILTTVLLLCFLNGVCFLYILAFGIDDAPGNVAIETYGIQLMQQTYPHLAREELAQLLTETWSRPFVYEPFTQFKERPYAGRYVNVTDQGFRVCKEQGPWPPHPEHFNVFVFGGSTVFGYGLADDETVASRLQEMLGQVRGRLARVYNFARGHYYSTQERILFEQLLCSGAVPDMAVFIDGLNDFYNDEGEPKLTRPIAEFVRKREEASAHSLRHLLDNRALTRVVRALFSREKPRDKKATQEQIKEYQDRSVLAGVIERFVRNKKIIESVAAAHGVRVVFVWQPVSTYKYDSRYNVFADRWGWGEVLRSRYGYALMAEFLKEHPQGANFLWLADMQQHEQKPLYVDAVHYSGEMCGKLARRIVDLLQQRGLLGPPPG